MFNPLPPVFQTAGSAPAYWFLDILWIILAGKAQTGGQFTIMEQLMPKGAGPGPHVHPVNDEWFYVLDGTLDMQVGGQNLAAGPGQSVFIPRTTVHAFKVTSATCRVLNGFTPAAMDEIITSLARPAANAGLPPPGLDHDPAILAKFANNDVGHTV